MPDVRIDESVTPAAHRAALIAALEARRVDNRFHYVGELASSRWRDLAASHSPAQDADDGVVAYDDAAKAVIAALPEGPVHVIGLACGDGVKERRLLGALRSAGREDISATAVDVSVPLVGAADAAMAQVPGVVAIEGVAVDIGAVPDLSPLLSPSKWPHPSGAPPPRRGWRRRPQRATAARRLTRATRSKGAPGAPLARRCWQTAIPLPTRQAAGADAKRLLDACRVAWLASRVDGGGRRLFHSPAAVAYVGREVTGENRALVARVASAGG